MKDLLTRVIANSLFDTYREVEEGGETWLVVNGVPLVEGVLNGRYVPADEFGAFAKDWNGIPVVLRHPKKNGRSGGAARVPAPVLDVPIVGYFYNADVDGKRLVGEFWLKKDELLKHQDGEAVYNRIVKNRPVEVSTAYYSAEEFAKGEVDGKPYLTIDHDIHPDHIALLPDEIGACSIDAGCGLNRNSLGSLKQHGGPGSGNFDHAGRPGKVGGSQ